MKMNTSPNALSCKVAIKKNTWI
uniref:Uncharacterized protein n=1 Tax=Rhizophora mucronata TaxID=61149 RepID=A0A2P2QH08_RHIMU